MLKFGFILLNQNYSKNKSVEKETEKKFQFPVEHFLAISRSGKKYAEEKLAIEISF